MLNTSTPVTFLPAARSFAQALSSRLFPRVADAEARRSSPPIPITGSKAADQRIREEMLARLNALPEWDAETTNVWVEDGVVILQGLTLGNADRHTVRTIARSVTGVRDLVDFRTIQRDW